MARKTASKPAKRRARRTAKAKEQQAAAMNPGRRYELAGLAIFAAGLISLCGLLGLNVGFVGLSFAKVLHYLFGIGAIVPTLLLLLIGWLYMTKHHGIRYSVRFFGLALLFLSVLAIWHHFVIPPGREILPESLARGGGLAGGAILFVLRKFFGVDGTIILLGIAVVGAVLLSTTWSLAKGLLKTQEKVERGASVTAGAMETAISVTATKAVEAGSAVTEHVSEKVAALRKKRSFYNQEKDPHFAENPEEDKAEMPDGPHTETVRASEVTKVTDAESGSMDAAEPAEPKAQPAPKFTIEYSTDHAEGGREASESSEPSGEEAAAAGMQADARTTAAEAAPLPDGSFGMPGAGANPSFGDYLRPTPKATPEAQAADAALAAPPKPYVLPKVTEILSKHAKKKNKAMEIEIEENARTLQQTLENFKVKATILNACHGPAVTRYELEPAPGVKVSKITNLSEDIALALAATSVRIEPIPGKAAIGIEVPNSELEGVQLREVLESEKFARAKSKLTVGLGMDIGGQAIFADLAKMPHLLVAGATGSGKSVCINTLICSILFKAKPDEVKFILVDPKMVELSNYNGIPHLMVPVVTEAKKAASVLNWSVQEMEKRYAKFAEHNVRNMDTYNRKFPDDKMPAIVIIIDELADLMMVAPHDVEDAICRLAQKARAAGIHMVLATQRPSVDVITGIIKANIPSRISFAVSSQIDSRTILDRSGAEKLLGKGDMLFYPVGASKPLRVQGAFISDDEVEKLLAFIRAQGQEMETNEEIVAFTERELQEKEEGEKKGAARKKPAMDALLPDAVALIYSTGVASTSSVQRRFSIGYTHAARLIDTMEELGIVSGSNGSKPRDILMSAEEAGAAVDRAMQGGEEPVA